MPDQPSDTAAPTSAPTRRRLDKGLLLASLVIAGGLILIGWGLLAAVTGDEGVDRPDAIESIFPVENAAQVLQQTNVVADLEFGYQAELEIDGVLLPTTRIGEVELDTGEQLNLPPTPEFDAGNSRISFQPVDGAPIESFTQGRHQYRLTIWKLEEGRGSARSYLWSFNVV